MFPVELGGWEVIFCLSKLKGKPTVILLLGGVPRGASPSLFCDERKECVRIKREREKGVCKDYEREKESVRERL